MAEPASSKLVKLKVHACSGRMELVQRRADAYEAWVRAPAENGRANAEALAALARALQRNPSQLTIVKGKRTPNKIVRVYGV